MARMGVWKEEAWVTLCIMLRNQKTLNDTQRAQCTTKSFLQVISITNESYRVN